MNRLDQPTIPWMAHRNRRATAETLVQWFGSQRAPIDVFGLAAALGITVHKVESPGWDGACRSDTEGNANVWIDASDATTRQRFTMAHEIGHLMLHPIGTTFRDTRGSMRGSPIELEANAFAAELLMPAFFLLPNIRALRGDIHLLASLYEVSETAMNIRMANLYGV